MMTDDRRGVLLIMLAAVVALSLGETALARGMKQSGRAEVSWVAQGIAVVSNRWVLAGTVLIAVHLGLYLLVLRHADLSFALPLTAATYPLSAPTGSVLSPRRRGTARWLGTLLITAGVAIVLLGERAGDH